MFKDRRQAGALLARKLLFLRGRFDLVAAIPRGGVVVGCEVSKKLNLPLKALVIKKVPAYGIPELAAGAIGPGGFSTGKKNRQIEEEVIRRLNIYGGEADFRNKKVILVDDGIATGATIETAIGYLKKNEVSGIFVAAPVIPEGELERLKEMTDGVIAIKHPVSFKAIGEFYEDFNQVSDANVIQLLQR